MKAKMRKVTIGNNPEYVTIGIGTTARVAKGPRKGKPSAGVTSKYPFIRARFKNIKGMPVNTVNEGVYVDKADFPQWYNDVYHPDVWGDGAFARTIATEYGYGDIIGDLINIDCVRYIGNGRVETIWAFAA